MLTECFNIRVRFPRKPRKVEHADRPPRQVSFVINTAPTVPKRNRHYRGRQLNRKHALLKSLADGVCAPDTDDSEFFERFSSIRIQYDNSERKTIQEFQFKPEDAVDGNFADQLWPTLGGWNIDDLYGEVLFSVHHTFRPDRQPESDALISHLQQVFHIDNDKHERILRTVQEKEAPPLVLNVEVAEAKGLHGKDVNGLSDPFCTLFINCKQKHNTSMKPETLTPVWREYFSFPVSSVEDDVFNLEIWDYDPEESVADKMKRFGEVKSTKGLRVLMKEIVMTSSTTKQQNDFMGCMKIPIKRLPAEGVDKWFPLEGRDGGKNGNGKKNKGEILLRMALGTEKDKKVAAQEYRHVYHLLLVHELDEQNVPPHQWSGQFANKHSEYVLRQLQWQGGLTDKEMDLTKWLVLARVQCDHPLNSNIFPTLFQQVSVYLENQVISEDLVRKFWFTADKLVENYTGFVRNIHEFFLNNNNNVTAQIYHKLKTIGLIKDYITNHPPKQGGNDDPELKLSPESIVDKLEYAISKGANELFTSIARSDPNSTDTPLESMIKIGQLLIADLRIGLETSHMSFKELLGIDYFEITYRVYDEKFGDIVKPVINDVCSNLKHLDFREDECSTAEQDLTMGTTLFELYLAVRQFADLSSNLASQKGLNIAGSFHNWFYASVAQWLDIAFYKAMNRIKKAVQLDNLRPVDQYVQRSSSAVDTAHVFHQIQIFWNQLAWPEVEGSYTFIAKILDDLCRCIICYGEIMCRKVEQLEKGKSRGDKYEISDELCSAVNNIEYVGQEMAPICDKLGTAQILAGLAELKGENIGSQCRRTLETVMENAHENISNKVYEILEQVGLKIKPALERLLREGAETASEEEGVGKLMKYLDDNLIKLKNRTSQGGFEKIFVIIWENASVALHDLVRLNIEKRRPPSFFKQIENMLNILLSFFYPDEKDSTDIITQDKRIKELFDILEIHGASTPELILKYQQGRYDYQTSLPSKPGEFGMVTIRAHYCEDIHTLRIEVLNARNLKPTDSNGSSDPFVKIRIVPEEMYPSSPKYKTKVKKKTLFPLFDETFSIVLSAEEMSRAGLIQFSLKDHDIFGRNDFLGESFLPLGSIPFTASNTPLKDLPQKNIVLHKPKESTFLLSLENRLSDRVAQDFVKKERNKIGAVLPASER